MPRESGEPFGNGVLHEIHVLPGGKQASGLHLGPKAAERYHRRRIRATERCGSRRLCGPEVDVNVKGVYLLGGPTVRSALKWVGLGLGSVYLLGILLSVGLVVGTKKRAKETEAEKSSRYGPTP